MANNFAIYTQKHCFLCLKDIQNQSVSNHSIQHLSNYLKLDRRKVFTGEGTIPKHLEAQVVKSRLMVQLCGDCASWNESFSENYKQLEKARMEVLGNLNFLQKVMKVSGKNNHDMWERLTGSGHSNSDEHLKEKLVIADTLRNDLIKKNEFLLSTDCPRVKLQKLSQRDTPIRRQLSPSSIQNIKLDVEFHYSLNDGDQAVSDEGGDHYMDYLDEPEQSHSFVRMESAPEPDHIKINLIRLAVQTVTQKGTQKLPHRHSRTFTGRLIKMDGNIVSRGKYPLPSLKDSVSGKYKCIICKGMYQTKKSLKNHHMCVHQKIRHRCPSCPKQFSDRSACNRHYKTAYVGVRYQCTSCNQIFSQTSHLRWHQQKICGKKARGPTCHCHVCGQGFSYRESLHRHLRNSHSIMRDIPCGRCERKFYLDSELEEHHRKVHAEVIRNGR